MHRFDRIAEGRTRASAIGRTLGPLIVLGVLAACAIDAPTRPSGHPEVTFAKGGAAGPSVNAANPNYGHQGDVLTVRVYGSGFATGAKATWAIGGDTTQVITNSTTYVSSSELVVSITVTAGAPLSLYDITVTNRDGKKGVGVEMFAVTTSEVLGTGTVGGDAVVLGMNDLGYVVGYAGPPFVFDGNTMISLVSGQAWGIDPSGTVVVGRDSVSQKIDGATMWNRTSPGVYRRVMFPMLPNSVGGIARKVAAAPNGDLLAVGSVGFQVTKQQRDFKPVLWRRTGSTWSMPAIHPMPGYTGTMWDVNGQGQMVGWSTLTNGERKSIIWENATSYTVLDDIANAINEAGTLVVGMTWASTPIFWYRDPNTQQWNPNPVALPMGSWGCAKAEDVNDAGILVGGGCVWRLDMSQSPPVVMSGPTVLPGLGQPVAGQRWGSPKAISNTAPYVVAGQASSTPNRLAVKWVLP